MSTEDFAVLEVCGSYYLLPFDEAISVARAMLHATYVERDWGEERFKFPDKHRSIGVTVRPISVAERAAMELARNGASVDK